MEDEECDVERAKRELAKLSADVEEEGTAEPMAMSEKPELESCGIASCRHGSTAATSGWYEMMCFLSVLVVTEELKTVVDLHNLQAYL